MARLRRGGIVGIRQAPAAQRVRPFGRGRIRGARRPAVWPRRGRARARPRRRRPNSCCPGAMTSSRSPSRVRSPPRGSSPWASERPGTGRLRRVRPVVAGAHRGRPERELHLGAPGQRAGLSTVGDDPLGNRGRHGGGRADRLGVHPSHGDRRSLLHARPVASFRAPRRTSCYEDFWVATVDSFGTSASLYTEDALGTVIALNP